jgi:hypothetical protein
LNLEHLAGPILQMLSTQGDSIQLHTPNWSSKRLHQAYR